MKIPIRVTLARVNPKTSVFLVFGILGSKPGKCSVKGPLFRSLSGVFRLEKGKTGRLTFGGRMSGCALGRRLRNPRSGTYSGFQMDCGLDLSIISVSF